MPAAGAHQPTFFSLRGPAKALHQRAREAPEFKIQRLILYFYQLLKAEFSPITSISKVEARKF